MEVPKRYPGLGAAIMPHDEHPAQARQTPWPYDMPALPESSPRHGPRKMADPLANRKLYAHAPQTCGLCTAERAYDMRASIQAHAQATQYGHASPQKAALRRHSRRAEVACASSPESLGQAGEAACGESAALVGRTRVSLHTIEVFKPMHV